MMNGVLSHGYIGVTADINCTTIVVVYLVIVNIGVVTAEKTI
jgi:hypothetical protein